MTMETYAEAMLTAGVTGAGLVLAVYTLAVGKASELLSNRTQAWQQALEQLRREVGAISADTKKERIDSLQTQLSRVGSQQELPYHLGTSVLASFIGYTLVALFSIATLDGLDYFGFWIGATFVVTTIVFLLTGAWIIMDIRRALQKQYQEHKREAEKKPATFFVDREK